MPPGRPASPPPGPGWRLDGWATTTSAPSTCWSACSWRATTWPLGSWSPTAWTWRRSGPRSTGSSTRACSPARNPATANCWPPWGSTSRRSMPACRRPSATTPTGRPPSGCDADPTSRSPTPRTSAPIPRRCCAAAPSTSPPTRRSPATRRSAPSTCCSGCYGMPRTPSRPTWRPRTDANASCSAYLTTAPPDQAAGRGQRTHPGPAPHRPAQRTRPRPVTPAP
jgi:hypothetical protein